MNRNQFRCNIGRSLCMGALMLSPLASHAELSLGVMAGLADYTTVMRGDALYAYTGIQNYYLYPADINTKDFALAPMVRYLRAVNDKFSLGLAAGYVFLNQDKTVLRADDTILVPGLMPVNQSPTPVENFTTKSSGLVFTNVVASFNIVPTVNFSVFGGPAWLNSTYIANDFAQHTVRTTGSGYQITADVGAEAEWHFKPNWSLGMRYDYVFNTDNRTVATTGAPIMPVFTLSVPTSNKLVYDNVAKSGYTMISATLRYLIPGS